MCTSYRQLSVAARQPPAMARTHPGSSQARHDCLGLEKVQPNLHLLGPHAIRVLVWNANINSLYFCKEIMHQDWCFAPPFGDKPRTGLCPWLRVHPILLDFVRNMITLREMFRRNQYHHPYSVVALIHGSCYQLLLSSNASYLVPPTNWLLGLVPAPGRASRRGTAGARCHTGSGGDLDKLWWLYDGL